MGSVAEVLGLLVASGLDAVSFLGPLMEKGFNEKDKVLAMTNEDVKSVFPESAQLRRKLQSALTKLRKKRKAVDGAESEKQKKQVVVPVEMDRAPRLDNCPASEEDVLLINRSPVMILWGIVMAERLGFDWDTALSISSMMAGLNARAKGKSLGLASSSSSSSSLHGVPSGWEPVTVCLLGRVMDSCVRKEDDQTMIRGRYDDGMLIRPSVVFQGLVRSFQNEANLRRAYDEMTEVAKLIPQDRLLGQDNRIGYDMYCDFRPEISEGRAGWGQKGRFEFEKIRCLKTDTKYVDLSRSIESVLAEKGPLTLEELKESCINFDENHFVQLQLDGIIYKGRGDRYQLL